MSGIVSQNSISNIYRSTKMTASEGEASERDKDGVKCEVEKLVHK